MNDEYMEIYDNSKYNENLVPFLLSWVFSFPKDKNIVMVMATYRDSQN